jgi:IS30 family transposase
VGFTAEQGDDLWDRWRRGDSSRLIARTLRCQPATVCAFVAKTGGVRPAPPRRSERHLTAAEREEVSRGIAAGLSARGIAALLGRSPSTVSREIARNGGRAAYRAAPADSAAWERARRPKTSCLASNAALRADVRDRLEEDWSPEQIAAWLRREHPANPSRWVSHETIYRTIYVAGRRELGSRASRHLRSGRSVRQPRIVRDSHGRGQLRNMVSIHARPAVVTERTEVGHWEGDLVMGKRPSAVATLVERSTRFVRIVPLPNGYKAEAVRRALADDLAQLPPAMRRSLTWDRGREMAEHQELAAQLRLDVYFCDPRSPWQRGSNENTNRLLRQYLGKGADLRSFSTRDLDDIAARINSRPRRVLDWSTAREQFWPRVRAASTP